ncbi:hypothetical protein JOC75_004026 [Metabacillus crassostreae]|uniref:hypothetical protein n=1 Tax=Metabacillus crassostreae TaxID=929098 RepID=UPI001958E8C1|nr:hypothetical protein [Metabacillus crassostreae]MBM7605998.1 hypothetical protein [Metabacillus crassostreae]
MPEIELLTFDMIWESAGPAMITAIVIFLYIIVSLIIIGIMRKGLLRDITGIGIMVGLGLVTFASFIITSNIWGS